VVAPRPGAVLAPRPGAVLTPRPGAVLTPQRAGRNGAEPLTPK
jgi:hypothetical protein